jgi:ABC-type thiamine transport system ATPase subunit
MTSAYVLSQFATLQSNVDELRGRVHAQEDVVAGLKATLAHHDEEVALLALTNTALDALLQQVNAESLGEIERLVTFGLTTVFPDLPLRFSLPVSVKRGTQWVEPRLQIGAIDAPILDSFGGGPAQVVAFLLRLIVMRRAGLAPLLLLDETFSMVSAQYVPNLSKLLKELSARFHSTFIVVTHDPALAELADHRYEISDTAEGAVFAAR